MRTVMGVETSPGATGRTFITSIPAVIGLGCCSAQWRTERGAARGESLLDGLSPRWCYLCPAERSARRKDRGGDRVGPAIPAIFSRHRRRARLHRQCHPARDGYLLRHPRLAPRPIRLTSDGAENAHLYCSRALDDFWFATPTTGGMGQRFRAGGERGCRLPPLRYASERATGAMD